MKSAFFALLIVALLAFSLFPYSHATSISVQYTTNDNSDLASVKMIYANGTNNGAIIGASWVAGKIGNALSFDAVNDYVNCGHNASLNILSPISFEAWVKLDPAWNKQGTIIGKRSGISIAYGIWISQAKTSLGIWMWDGANIQDQIIVFSFQTNVWYHIVVTFNDTTNDLILYVNGTAYASTTAYTFRQFINNNLTLGSYDANVGASDFRGIIDELLIYERELSQAEVTYNYNSGLGRQQPYSTQGLVCWLNMDEGSSSKVYGYNSIATFNTHSTPQTLTISQTASAPNSSLNFYNLPFSNSTHKYNDTNYSWRVNNTSTQTLALNHYVYVNFTGVPTAGGLLNQTSRFYKTITSYNILATPYAPYYFLGWYYIGGLITSANPTSFQFTAPVTINGIFVLASSSTPTTTTPSVDTSLTVLPSYIWDVGAIIASFFFLILAFKWPVFGFIAFSISIIVFLNDISNGWAYNVLYRNGTTIMSNTVYVAIPTWYFSVIGVIILIQVFTTILLAARSR